MRSLKKMISTISMAALLLVQTTMTGHSANIWNRENSVESITSTNLINQKIIDDKVDQSMLVSDQRERKGQERSLPSSGSVAVSTYGELQQALATASVASRIELLNDLSPNDGSVVIGDPADIVTGATLTVTANDVLVNGNGFKIQGNGYPTFYSNGGGLTVEDMIIDGAGYYAKFGGAVYVDAGGTIHMENVTIKNSVAGNTSASGGGGAVYASSHGGTVPTFTADNCKFLNNTALSGRGGAIYGSTANVTLTNCIFEENRAANGGGVAMDGLSQLNILNSQISGNEAEIAAGGIYVYHGDSVGRCDTNITSRVMSVVDSNSIITGNIAGIVGDNMVYGRYYSENYVGNQSETTLAASIYEDITFTDIERTRPIAERYGFRLQDGQWQIYHDDILDAAEVVQSITDVTIDGKIAAVTDVFTLQGKVRLDHLAVFEQGYTDCYKISVTGTFGKGTQMVGDVSLQRWEYEAGWESFINYVDSTESRMIDLWERGALANGMTIEQFKNIFRAACNPGNGIDRMVLENNIITAFRADGSIIFSNEYECIDKLTDGWIDLWTDPVVVYGLKAVGTIDDENFRYIALFELMDLRGKPDARFFNFRYGISGFETLNEGECWNWYPTMCHDGISLDDKCKYLEALFDIQEGKNGSFYPGSNSDSGSGGSSSSKPTSKTTVSGEWKLDENGWWYSYSDGTWASNCWLYLEYGGVHHWYHFNQTGYMDEGWFADLDGKVYYLNSVSDGTRGAMKTGWILVDQVWYYFQPSGEMLKDGTTPDGYQLDLEGKMI